MTLAERFDAAMVECRRLAEADHSHRLRGRHVKSFDAQGVHAFSRAVGAAHVLGELLTEHGVEANVDPVAIMAVARVAAEKRFAKDVAERGVEVFAEARSSR